MNNNDSNEHDELDLKRLSNKLDDIIESVVILKKDPFSINDNQLLDIKVLSESKIHLFRNKEIIQKLKSLLNTKLNIKSSIKLNVQSLLHIHIVSILFKVYEKSSNWPIWILESFVHDSMSHRCWINSEDNNVRSLYQNLYNYIENSNNDDNNMEMDISEEMRENTVIIDIIDTSSSPIITNRYSKLKSKAKNTLIQLVEVYLNGNISVNIIQTLLNLSKISEIRTTVSKNLNTWIKVPIFSDIVRNLSKSIIENIEFDDTGNFRYSTDIRVLDDIIKLKSHMQNHLDMYKVSLKIAFQRSNIAAMYILKGLILSDIGMTTAETFKLISSLLKESVQSSQSEILGNSIAEANISYFISNGQWTLQSSKIFLDSTSKLLRQCYFETFSIINFGRSFLSVISKSNLPDPTCHEWLLYLADVTAILQLLRFNDSIAIDSRDSVNIRNTLSTKSNFVNIKELSKSTKNSGPLKLSNQVKISESIQKVKSVSASTEVVVEDVSKLQELLIIWICQRINLKSDEAIDLIKHSCCIIINPRISIDVDKKCHFLLRESGCITESIIKSLAHVAINLSKSLEEISLWIELIEAMCYRTLKAQQIEIDDVHGVLLSLFSLCTLDIRTSDNSKSNLIEDSKCSIKNINLIASSTDTSNEEDCPYKKVLLERGDRIMGAALPLMVYKVTYWSICRLVYFLACARPDTVGRFVWDELPTLRDLMTMTISSRYENIDSSKATTSPILFSDRCKKYEGKKGGVVISPNCLQLFYNSSPCNCEEILQEFEFEIWKYLFGDGKSIENPEDKEVRRKRDYERWEMKQEKLALQAKRELQQENRSLRAALRMAKKEGKDVLSEPIEVETKKRKLEVDSNNAPKEEIFNYISPPHTEPYTTQFGLPEQESIMFLSCKDIGRSPPISIVQQIIALDNKFKLGVRLRSCTDPDFISRTLVDCDEQSLNRNIRWLLPTVSVDIENVLGRLPVSALAHLLRMVVFRIFQRFQSNSAWHFNHIENFDRMSSAFFDFSNAKNEVVRSLLLQADHNADMNLITALVLRLQMLFIDWNSDNTERITFLKIICSELGHEEFNRRSVSRLLLGYFFKLQSKSSPCSHLDEVTTQGPIYCDYMLSLKTIWLNLYNNHDDSNTIIIDSLSKAIKNEGNVTVIRRFMELLQWIEEQCISLSSSSQLLLSTKAIVLLLSSKPLTARHIMTFININEFEIYLKSLVESILSSSNQAYDLTSDVASVQSNTNINDNSVYINIRVIDLSLDSLLERKININQNEGLNSVAVRVDALRSLLIIAILHESAFDNLNTPIMQCSLSALASLSALDISNYFIDIIVLMRTIKSTGYCRLVQAILPRSILMQLLKHYSGFSLEFLKAAADTIDRSIALGIESWDQIVKILGKSLSKVAEEFHPLLKYLEFQSSLSSSSSSSLQLIELHSAKIQQYLQQSITLKNISDVIKANHLKPMDMDPQLPLKTASLLSNDDVLKVNQILSSSLDYQSLHRQLFNLINGFEMDKRKEKLQDTLKFVLSSASSTAPKITIVEIVNNILIMLTDRDILLSLALTDLSDNYGLQSNFISFFFPLNTVDDAWILLNRVVDIMDDKIYDNSGIIFILIHVISNLLNLSSLLSSQIDCIISKIFPILSKMMSTLTINSTLLTCKLSDLSFLKNYMKKTNIIVNNEHEIIEQLMDFLQLLINKLVAHVDIKLAIGWIDCIMTDLNDPNIELNNNDIVYIGKSIVKTTVHEIKANFPSIIIN